MCVRCCVRVCVCVYADGNKITRASKKRDAGRLLLLLRGRMYTRTRAHTVKDTPMGHMMGVLLNLETSNTFATLIKILH